MESSDVSSFVNLVIQEIEAGRISSQLVDKVNSVLPFGLDFSDIYHSNRAKNLVGGFDGKRVLELGGALNPHFVKSTLLPRSWSAVEYVHYDDNQFSSTWNNIEGSNSYSYDDTGWCSFFKKWQDVCGAKFNIVYSVAALEHIDELFKCLCACHEMLEEGGIFYAYFTPIWSAPNGSHGFLPSELGDGTVHEHLRCDYVSLIDQLCSNYSYSVHAASQKAFALYKSQQLNRHTCEEFELMFKAAPFAEKKINAINKVSFQDIYSADICESIASFYPGMKSSCGGFEFLMRK